MASLLGPYNSGAAVGAEGSATANFDTPTVVNGKLNAVYIKYNILPTTTTNVIVNGTFEDDDHWTKGENWTIPAAKKATAAAATENLTATVAPLSIASMYWGVYTLVVTSGTIRFTDGVTNGATRSASGTYGELFTAAATGAIFDPQTAFTGTIDNVAVYEYDPHLLIDIIISTVGNTLPSYSLLVYEDLIADIILRPRVLPHSALGASLAALTLAEPWPVCDNINIKIDQAVAGDNVDVWLLVE
jgi:hypothetical protein